MHLSIICLNKYQKDYPIRHFIKRNVLGLKKMEIIESFIDFIFGIKH